MPDRMMKLKDGTSEKSVDIKELIESGADLKLYEEDLVADSIDNWVRNKKIAMKVLN